MFWDAMSLLILPILALPALLVFFDKTRQVSHVLIILGAIICELLIKLSRRVFPKKGVFLRPSDAINCNLFNRGGNYANRIGMPSGHMALTTFVISSLIYVFNPSYSVALLGVIIIILMGFSRYFRKCHNMYQVIAGAVLGLSLFGIFRWLNQKLNKEA